MFNFSKSLWKLDKPEKRERKRKSRRVVLVLWCIEFILISVIIGIYSWYAFVYAKEKIGDSLRQAFKDARDEPGDATATIMGCCSWILLYGVVVFCTTVARTDIIQDTKHLLIYVSVTVGHVAYHLYRWPVFCALLIHALDQTVITIDDDGSANIRHETNTSIVIAAIWLDFIVIGCGAIIGGIVYAITWACGLIMLS